MALRLALNIKKPDAKHASFHECLRKVSQKCQDGISLLVKGKEPEVPKSPSIHPNQVFLGSCSSFIQVTDKSLLSDAHKSDTYLCGYCNTGTSITNLKGKFGEATFGKDTDTWLHAGITNIISIPVIKSLISTFCTIAMTILGVYPREM